MRRCLTTLVILALAFPIWGALASAMAASETNQQSTTEELRPVEECQMSDAARDAINAAWDREGRTSEGLELIFQAQEAAGPPECDNEKAIELAEQAKTLADKAKQPAEGIPVYDGPWPKQPKTPLTSASAEFVEDCSDFAVDQAKKSYGPDFLISLITTAPITTTFCLLATPFVISTEVSSSEDEVAYQKLQQYRFVAVARDNLVKDMARGGGEYLSAMAYLQGCPAEVHNDFANMTQRHFNQIFPQPEMDTKTILLNLEAQIALDTKLAVQCSEIS